MSRFSNQINSEEAYALALIICDRVVSEADGQRTIVGTFDTLASEAFPFTFPRLSVYVAIAKGNSDESTFYLGLVSPSGELLLKSVLEVTEWNEIGIVELALALHEVPFTAAGDYVLRLFSDHRRLLERRILLRTPPPPAEGPVL
jgi:hypothetical protein